MIISMQTIVLATMPDGGFPAFFATTNLQHNLQGMARILNLGTNWTPFGWQTLLMLAVIGYLKVKQRIWTKMPPIVMGYLAMPVLFFLFTAASYSWPIFHNTMWRFFSFLMVPSVLLLHKLKFKPTVVLTLMVLQLTNTGWQRYRTATIYVRGVEAAILGTAAIQAPDICLTVPYRVTSYNFGVTKKPMPAFAITARYSNQQELPVWSKWPNPSNYTRTRILEQNGMFFSSKSGFATKIFVYRYDPKP
jgi:hypothetical protein